MRFFSWPQRYWNHWVGSRRLAIVEACVIGVVSGLAAVLLKQGIGWLGSWRVQLSYQMPPWIVLPLLGLLGGLAAGLLIERLAPEAAGSGIPQVKAVLANVPMALNLRVACVKMVSVIIALGAGLNLGRQGPTVQIGAALAAQLSQWLPTSPEYRRQLIAAGAAAGLAAGFNAPIAGVLFVVEEFLQDFSGLTLGTAILASFIGAVVSRLLGGQSLSLTPALAASTVNFSLQDVPFFLVLGLLAGLLGALFSRGIFASLALYRRMQRLGLPLKIGLAGLLTGVISGLLPDLFRDNTGLQEFVSAGNASLLLILLTFVTKFLLTLVAYGAGTPGGLFAPALLLGASLGHLVGNSAQWLELWIGLPAGIPAGVSAPSTYALAGMGAFFSAVTRGPITAIVIVFEITTDFNLVLPLMIGSVVAYLIADRTASGSIYKHLLAWNGIHLDNADPDHSWTALRAADLMQPRVETLASSMPLEEAVQAFSRSHHRGFPVVDQGRLVGIVTQGDLSNRDRRPLKPSSADSNAPDSSHITLADIMTPQPVTVHPHDPLTHVLYLLNRFNLSRLPVTEGQKLVGIITRADIIRAEADQINGNSAALGPQPQPSYLVYQTRAPATGRGRILVPLSNPDNAPVLIRLAAALATARSYELECLQVIAVPRSQAPQETAVRTTRSRRLLKQAEQWAQTYQVPIHTQIRLAHDPAQAILETVQEQHIDLVLMGWKGSTRTPGRIFGSVVDTVVRQADCEVVLVKLQDHTVAPVPTFNHWLVPVAGGPNAQVALGLLPALLAVSPFDRPSAQAEKKPEVKICRIFDQRPTQAEISQLQKLAMNTAAEIDCVVGALPLWGMPVAEAIVKLAAQKHCDVIMLGASREGLLQQVIKGNIPEAITRESTCTVILVRGAITAN
ncbi:MAG: chloride channel protein [Elainella sp.]